MKHGNSHRIFGRIKNQRTALMRGLAVSLIRDSQIKTTTAKARELRPFIEKLITKSRENTISTRRLVASKLGEPKDQIIRKLFDSIAPKFKSRAGGYTRVVKLNRTKAGRDEAIIEFVE